MARKADWSRKLPRPLKIPGLMTLRTLADVRTLIGYLPARHRKRGTWQVAKKHLNTAAHGGNIDDAVVALEMVFILERIECLPQ